MRTSLAALLKTQAPILADGAMGTMLFQMGLAQGAAPEGWNLEHPDRVLEVHRQYIEAGSQILLTNTFGGNGLRLALHNLEERVVELNRKAAELACQAADAATVPVAVGGSMGPTGGFMQPLGELTFDQVVSVFKVQATGLAEGGVDVFWIETMYDLAEVEAAVAGCRQAAPDLPIVTTMTFDTAGKTMMGVAPAAAAVKLNELGAIALGGNCGNGTAEIEKALETMAGEELSVPLIAKSNAGIPHLEGGVPVYDASPDQMAQHARRALELGATIIGGCCGTTPEHIRQMAAALSLGERAL